MSTIEELNGRIMAAMERIAKGVDALGEADAGETEALRQALEDEKQASAQLEERVRVLGERQEQTIAALEARAEEAVTRMQAFDTELQQLRAAHTQLIEACDALRSANAEGVGDAGLINLSMQAELESIRAMRSAERAEADEIIAALTPLLQSAAQEQSSEEVH
ncbi:MAG: hypothetical protein AAF665_13135 [Pseudomonadota bacterium]